MANAYITRLAVALPGEPISNDEMESVLGMINGKPSRVRRVILRSNGIQTRHYAIDPVTREPTYNTAQLAAAAIRHLEQMPPEGQSGWTVRDIDLIAAGTSAPDQVMPGHASMVHGELAETGALEVHSTAGVCCAGVGALKYAWMSVVTGQKKNAIATAADVSSGFMRSEMFEHETQLSPEDLEAHPQLAFDRDFLRWMLSDGAGAMLLQPQPAPDRLSLRVEWIDLFSHAFEQPACMYCGAIKTEDGRLRGYRTLGGYSEAAKRGAMHVAQDVRQLNSNVVSLALEKPLEILLKKRDLAASDIDWFVPHFSSMYFREPLMKATRKLGFDIPAERWYTNLPTVGNIGSASIYVALEELMRSGKVQPGHRILCFVPESGRFSAGFIRLTAVAPGGS